MRRIQPHFWVFPVLLGLLVVVLAGLADHPGRPAPDKINLALRRTAHHLLVQSGDSTSLIPPVERGDKPGSWIIRLERPFDYHALPALLQESFDLHGIKAEYDVTLLDCANWELLLGYNKRDFTENNDPPCGTREQNGRCYNLQVSFTQSSTPAWPLWLAALILLPLGYFLYQGLKKRSPSPPPLAPEENAQNPAIVLGQSSLDMANQTLTTGGVRHNLTYREAKLLQLFFRHPGQLLERDFILQQVWADEGILVGRSVDMFVSRLRKLLRADTSLRITTVHGVGYRLEV